MKTLKVDVIVVGAGPAGVAAVRTLTGAGAKVALIEKVSFPRTKPCAGGLTVGALRLLDYSVTKVVREDVNECQLSYNFKTPVLIKSEKPFAAMTKRIELDALGLDIALATGCHFLVLPDIQGLKQDDHGVELLYSDIRVQSDYLVAADGASSSIRRLIYGRENKNNAIAIEANVDSVDVSINCVRTRVDFCVAKGGYGWVFPKGDHYNIGLYTWSSNYAASINRPSLRQYALETLGTEKLLDVQGFPIATSCSKKLMATGRILFVGDAGGFSYSVTGEGIYGAILTGQLAAKAIIDGGDVANAYRLISSRLLRRCHHSSSLSRIVYPTLRFSYPLFANRLNKQVRKAATTA